jgi:hypothetical protein
MLSLVLVTTAHSGVIQQHEQDLKRLTFLNRRQDRA